VTLDIYQVDAFSRGPFTGNPAAVIPLKSWLPDQTLQQIAEENNLSETAYFVRSDDGYHIRWFTPQVEVNLCGHATLAAAHVIFSHLNYTEEELEFQSKSGKLSVTKTEDAYTLNFPTDEYTKIKPVALISNALGIEPIEWYRGKDDYMLILEHEDQIKKLNPDFGLLSQSDGRGCLVTASGSEEFDFVSRGFFPQSGINEDPATGSAHTTLTPYWSNRLDKKELIACQLSSRKGYFKCKDLGNRTQISGKCIDYLIGKIKV